MENSKQLALELYGVRGFSKANTQILKTKGGNYIYRHVFSGNSKQDARVYNPVTGEDRFLENAGYFHHLVNHLNVDYITAPFTVVGSEVETHFNK